MQTERRNAILEELQEVESLAELKALWCFGQREADEYNDPEVVPHFKTAARRLKGVEIMPATVVELSPEKSPAELLESLMQEIQRLKAAKVAELEKPQPVRSTKKYKLLSTDVSWSTKPQVHAMMDILKAHAQVGDVLDEDHIVQMMVENEAVLETRQGGKRIWDYYKGNSAEGLLAHGNIERA